MCNFNLFKIRYGQIKKAVWKFPGGLSDEGESIGGKHSVVCIFIFLLLRLQIINLVNNNLWGHVTFQCHAFFILHLWSSMFNLFIIKNITFAEDTAIREVYEETGVKSGTVQIR